MPKLPHLPKIAFIALVLGLVILGSGVTYAAYKLWLEPEASTTSSRTNQYGHHEQLLALKNCQSLGDSATFELKKGTTVQATEVAAIVQAGCETKAFAAWLEATWPSEQFNTTQATNVPGLAYKIDSIDAKSLRVINEAGEAQSFNLTPDTNFIANGQFIKVASMTKGDYIALGLLNTFASAAGGAPIKTEVLALAKLSLPAKYYQNDYQNALLQRTECSASPHDYCLQTASVDVYPQTEGLPNKEGAAEIQGKLTAWAANSFTITGSSGTTYTVATPSNILADFNQSGGKTRGLTIEIGDMLSVHYAPGQDRRAITPSQLLYVQLLLEFTNKSTPLKKY